MLKVIPFQGFEFTCVMSTLPIPESPEDQMGVAEGPLEEPFKESFDEDSTIDFEIPGTPEYEYL